MIWRNLSVLKHSANADIAEIKYISHLLRDKLRNNTSQVNTNPWNHDFSISKNFWGYVSMHGRVFWLLYKNSMVLKLGKHQRSKQRCQDLGWKVHDRAQSFVLHSYTMHELRNQHVCVLCTVKAKKENKNLQQRNLSGFITIPLY